MVSELKFGQKLLKARFQKDTNCGYIQDFEFVSELERQIKYSNHRFRENDEPVAKNQIFGIWPVVGTIGEGT